MVGKKKRTLSLMTLREIRGSFGRFFAIFAIIALGVGFFSGLRITTPVMIHTVDSFYKEHHFYDYRVLSTLGFEEEDIASLRLEEDAAAVEGGWQYDVLVDREDGGTSVCKIYSITENINTLRLDEGRMPASADECVVDAENRMSLVLGDTLVLSSSNEKDTLEAFKNRRYTVVGFADTPLYINFERGTTTIGNGSVTGFAYFPREAFTEDYYTEAYVLLKDQEELFSDAYEERLDEGRDRWEDAVRKAADARYERLLADAEKELADAKDEFEEKKTDGEAELDDAEKELRDGKAELDDASSELKDGREQLTDAQAELSDAKAELDDARTQLDSARRELADAKKELDSGRAQLDASRKELEDGKARLEASREELADGKTKLDETRKELAAGKAQLDETKKQLDEGKKQLDESLSQLNAVKEGLDSARSELETKGQELAAAREQLDEAQQGIRAMEEQLAHKELLPPEQAAALEETYRASLEAYEAGKAQYDTGLAAYNEGKTQYEAGLAGYNEGKVQYEAALQQYNEGLARYEAGLAAYNEGKTQYETGLAGYNEGKAQYEAALQQYNEGLAKYEKGEEEYRKGVARYQSGVSEYNSGLAEYESGRKKYEDGLAEYESAKADYEEGVLEYEDGLKDYEDGLAEYRDGKETYDREIRDAEKKIADAEEELADFEEPDTYLLERNTNIAYECFKSDSSIVRQVAKVFPVFFILVAVLVCMTTMTRMVEEQRSQIGVLKGLGYSEGDIFRTFAVYSGSAAMSGCIFGYIAGIFLFPSVIWMAYDIMYISIPLEWIPEWKLAAVVFAVSAVCSLGTTYASVRHELREPAASLLRPKAPKAGKRVFLERIPGIWNRMRFMHKISARNILRYKKRFFMMIIGISGCTALLLTGFGIKDSIASFAEIQYETIQVADADMVFRNGKEDRMPEKLENAVRDRNASVMLYKGASWDLLSGGNVKSVQVIAPFGEEIGDFFRLHTRKGESLSLPENGEALISCSLAERYHIAEGDTIRLRDEDMNMITVRVAGVFENHVYNYVILAPEMLKEAVGEADANGAYVNFEEGADIYEAQAALASNSDVASVTLFEDFKIRLTKMMSSLNYIVLLVIVSAAGLAFVVLYNLTNINILERIREIATIKVLGFYRKETSDYVFRENLVLTAFGAALGLLLGVALHRFVIRQIVVDLVYFNITIRPVSFVLSVVLTFVFTILINQFMSFRIEKINMAESLKSVE